MAETPTKITLSGGAVVDAVSVPFQPIREEWSEYKLEDGTVIRVRPLPVEFYRVPGSFDADGNPSYYARTQTVLIPLGVPPHLRKAQ